jgi:hypothetical protein
VTAPERVTVAAADLATLTGVELFAALAHAGLTRSRLVEALAAIQDPEGNPNVALRGMRFLQATALELALREDPEPRPTWEDAQGWDVTADLSEVGDPLAQDRREYRVAAAVATGLDPDAAEDLAVADVEEYARVRRRMAGG